MPQYSESALEQELKRAERMPVGLPWRLLLFSIIVLGITAAIYLGMTFGYGPYLNSQIKTLDTKIASLGQTVGADQQKNLVNIYSQLNNIETLLDSHISASKIFTMLEQNTLAQVYFSSMTLTIGNRQIQLDGSAPSFSALASQLEIFKQSADVEKVSLSDSSLSDDGAVHFSMNLIFKPDLIK